MQANIITCTRYVGDNNKAISNIVYNYLNLPNAITVTSKGTITYTYDAAGNKLLKTTVEGTKTTNALYVGGIIYQNDTLQFIPHEEGRTRWSLHHYINGSTRYGFEYDYFLKDHLGNTRMVLTHEKDTAQYMATMEAAYRNTENQLFYNIPQSSYPRSAVAGYPTDNTTIPNDSLARVNGSGQKVGPSLLLRVMSGDVLDVATKSFYKSGGSKPGNTSVFTDILSALTGGIATTTSGSHGTSTQLSASGTPIYNALANFLPANNPDPAGKPKAYLNWILLDDQFNPVTTYPQSGAIVVGTADVLNTLAYSGIPITKNGYLYVWVSNETPGWDVFFDNLSVQHRSGAILEESHYYPFGLVMQGISSKALSKPENRYKYNGKELQSKEFSDGSGLEEYDFGARFYDPQLGRWNVPDPLSAIPKNMNSSPYNYSINNPILYLDPNGKDWVINGFHQDNKGNWTVDVTLKGAVVNASGKKFTNKQMNQLKNSMISQLETSFKGTLGKIFGSEVQMKTTADIRVLNKEKDLKSDEHLYRILDNSDSRVNGTYGGAEKLGGKVINLNADYVSGIMNGSDNNTIPHETGHTGYLFHPQVPTGTEGGTPFQELLQNIEGQNFSPGKNGVNKNNAMYSGNSELLNDKTSTEINSTQLRDIIINYYIGLINKN